MSPTSSPVLRRLTVALILVVLLAAVVATPRRAEATPTDTLPAQGSSAAISPRVG